MLVRRASGASPAVAVCSCLFVIVTLVGCAGDERRAFDPGSHIAERQTPPIHSIPRAEKDPQTVFKRGRGDRSATSNARRRVSPPRPEILPDGRRVTKGAGGGLTILPAPPKAAETEPSLGCEREDGAPPRPPRPGLRAVASSRRSLIVNYRFRRLARDCAPYWILLTLARGDGAEPSINRTHRARPEARIVARAPSYWRVRPDVVRASAITRDGRRGHSTSVKVSR